MTNGPRGSRSALDNRVRPFQKGEEEDGERKHIRKGRGGRQRQGGAHETDLTAKLKSLSKYSSHEQCNSLAFRRPEFGP